MGPSLCPVLQQLYSCFEPIFLTSQTLAVPFLASIHKVQAFISFFFTQLGNLLEKLNPISPFIQAISIKSLAMLTCLSLISLLVVSILWKRENRQGLFSPQATPVKKDHKFKSVSKA